MWATPFFHASQVRVSSPPQQNLCRPRVCLRSEVVLHDDGSGRRAGTESPIVARPQSPHPLLRRTHALQHPASSEGRPLGRRRANWRRDADCAGYSRCRLTLTRTLHLALMLASSPRRAGDSADGVARAGVEQGKAAAGGGGAVGGGRPHTLSAAHVYGTHIYSRPSATSTFPQPPDQAVGFPAVGAADAPSDPALGGESHGQPSNPTPQPFPYPQPTPNPRPHTVTRERRRRAVPGKPGGAAGYG